MGTMSLYPPCSSLACTAQCAKVLVGRAPVSDGNIEVLPTPAGSLQDHSSTEPTLKHSLTSLETLATVFCLTVSNFTFWDNFLYFLCH